jgi:hypothetical protein
LATAFTVSLASAQEIESRYTSMDGKGCKKTESQDQDGGGVSLCCPGLAGYVVVLSEDDIRQTVSVGQSQRQAFKEPAAETFFGPPNVTDPTVEWRVLKGQKPFAIIMRWRTPTGEEKKGQPYANQVLIVTRLPPGAVCHVAYVDAKANTDANMLARKAADELARDFKCDKDQVKVLGETGVAALLAKQKQE